MKLYSESFLGSKLLRRHHPCTSVYIRFNTMAARTAYIRFGAVEKTFESKYHVAKMVPNGDLLKGTQAGGHAQQHLAPNIVPISASSLFCLELFMRDLGLLAER